MMKAFFLLSTALVASTVTAVPDVVQAALQHTTTHRRTQEADPCVANGGDLLSVRSFYAGTLGKCQCSFVNDLDNLQDFDQDTLGDMENNPNYLNDVIGLINDLLRDLNYEYSNSCVQSDCETCFGPVCGTISAAEAIVVSGDSETNLTLTDLLTLPGLGEVINSGGDANEAAEAAASDTAALTSLFGPNLSSENSISYCMDFTTEFTGQACLKIENVLDGVVETEFSTEAQACTLSYNGQDCTGCEFVVAEGKSCVTADCTAVTSVNSMVDTCGGSGLVGPMQFLDVTAVAESTCGAQSVTTSCEGLGCETLTSTGGETNTETDASGATSLSLMTVGVASVVALMI